MRETLACSCSEHIVTAPGPDHSIEGARYGDSFRAFVVTSKCADAIPLYRQSKQMARLGLPVSRSTLTDLLHQAARQLAPLSRRLLELVAMAAVVQADETSLKMQKPNKRGFVWTFLADNLIAYRFSGDRSGQTPSAVLGATRGTLVVDMYTGYNAVTSTGARVRAACLAHVRLLFEAIPYVAEAREALEIIGTCTSSSTTRTPLASRGLMSTQRCGEHDRDRSWRACTPVSQLAKSNTPRKVPWAVQSGTPSITGTNSPDFSTTLKFPRTTTGASRP